MYENGGQMIGEFSSLRRRSRWLESEIAVIEHMLDPRGGPEAAHGTTALFVLNQYLEEMEEIDYLLRYWAKQNNGYNFSRWQWMAFSASIAIAAILLFLYLVQVMQVMR